MKKLNIAELSASLLEYVQALGDEPVALLHEGNPVAVLMPTPNSDMESVSLGLNPKFLAMIERSKESLIRDGGLSTEEVRRHLGLPERAKGKKKTDRRKPGAKKPKTKKAPSSGEADGSKV
jgi:hypothetical protein